MKEKFIKYERLSKDIKDEIEKYYKLKEKEYTSYTIEAAMVEWFDKKFDEWLIKHYTQKDSGGDKRKHFRLDVELPIKVINTLIESSSDDTEAQDLIGQVLNISRGGLYFKYNKAIEISSIIKVALDFFKVDSELEPVEALAMVVRSDQLGKDEFGIGVVFSSIYEGNKESLDVFILKNLSNYFYMK